MVLKDVLEDAYVSSAYGARWWKGSPEFENSWLMEDEFHHMDPSLFYD